jgi:hypothetical protein
MSRQLRPSPNCLNCGHAVSSRFCSECGQENTDYHVSIGRLVGDLFEELFQLESRLWRSLWTLFRRPGLLTREYNVGRRVSYTTPLRLYLIASVTYFFVGSVMPHRSEATIKFDPPTPTDAQDIEKAPPMLRGYLHRAMDAKNDPKAAGRRVQQALNEWGPRIAAGLVPFFAFLTWILFRRPKLFFVEHLVFALHLHATAFLLMTVGDLLRWWPVGAVTGVAIPVLMFLAMRRVFGQSRLRTSWKFVLVWIFYGVVLGAGIAVVAAIGFFGRS